jgi:hypothetical protein
MSKHGMAAGVIMLVPSNAALDAWLEAEQLSLDALVARKALAQRLVGYLVRFVAGGGCLSAALYASSPESCSRTHRNRCPPSPSPNPKQTLLPDGKLKAGKQVIPTANLEWNVTLSVGADGKAISATDAHDRTVRCLCRLTRRLLSAHPPPNSTGPNTRNSPKHPSSALLNKPPSCRTHNSTS